MVVVEKKDQVKIGGVAKLFAAELAVSDDGKSGVVAMFFSGGCPAQCQHMPQQQVGQVAQMVAEFFQRQQSLQIHCQQAECLFLFGMVQHVQLPLGISDTIIEAALQIVVDLLPL